MEKESNSKIEKLEKDIKKLKKRQPRKMTAMKFVGATFHETVVDANTVTTGRLPAQHRAGLRHVVLCGVFRVEANLMAWPVSCT